MTRIRRRLTVGHGPLLGLYIPILENGRLDFHGGKVTQKFFDG